MGKTVVVHVHAPLNAERMQRSDGYNFQMREVQSREERQLLVTILQKEWRGRGRRDFTKSLSLSHTHTHTHTVDKTVVVCI